MNKEQIFAIIQRGHLTDGDLADALLAELAKVSEPAGFIAHNPGGFYEGSHIPAAPYDYAKFHNGLPTAGTKLFTHPLPQPDLVAEIERLRNEVAQLQRDQEQYGPDKVAIQKQAWVEADRQRQINELRQQLSAAQADNETLVTSLEEVETRYFAFLKDKTTEAEKFKAEGDMHGWNFHTGAHSGAVEMHLYMTKLLKLATHKARKEKA